MISDEMLSQAAGEVAEAFLASLPSPEECTHTYSKRFARKMKRLCARQAHPVRFYVLRTAACILLALLLGFGSLLAVSAQAREAFGRWIRNDTETGFEVDFEGKVGEEDTARYHPGWIPSEYVVIEDSESRGYRDILYKSVDDLGWFTYLSVREHVYTGVYVYFEDFEDVRQQTVWINGLEGTLYQPADPSEASVICWMNSEGTTVFLVNFAVDADTLIRIAENIVAE